MMKERYCVDCRWFEEKPLGQPYSYDQADHHACMRTVELTGVQKLVYGKTTNKRSPAIWERMEGDYRDPDRCGPEGKYWDSRAKQVSEYMKKWQKFDSE